MAVELTVARLKELLHYDPETGDFTWVSARRQRVAAGDKAGCRHKASGYWVIRIDDRLYRAHRLAWLWVHGEWPKSQVDHINRIRDDNRFANLRPATGFENSRNSKRQANNTSGHRGVAPHQAGKWQAYINAEGKRHSLGLFDTVAAAGEAYRAAAKSLHGEFAGAA